MIYSPDTVDLIGQYPAYSKGEASPRQQTDVEITAVVVRARANQCLRNSNAAPVLSSQGTWTGDVEAVVSGYTFTDSYSSLACKYLDNLALNDAPSAVFDAIQRLYLSKKNPARDRIIAERITTLYRDAFAEGGRILPTSASQFATFFLHNDWTGIPRITLTSDGTLRVRWIIGKNNFFAIEFTGTDLVKIVSEVPRDGNFAQYFVSESISRAARFGRDIGASFA